MRIVYRMREHWQELNSSTDVFQFESVVQVFTTKSGDRFVDCKELPPAPTGPT